MRGATAPLLNAPTAPTSVKHRFASQMLVSSWHAASSIAEFSQRSRARACRCKRSGRRRSAPDNPTASPAVPPPDRCRAPCRSARGRRCRCRRNRVRSALAEPGDARKHHARRDGGESASDNGRIGRPRVEHDVRVACQFRGTPRGPPRARRSSDTLRLLLLRYACSALLSGARARGVERRQRSRCAHRRSGSTSTTSAPWSANNLPQ